MSRARGASLLLVYGLMALFVGWLAYRLVSLAGAGMGWSMALAIVAWFATWVVMCCVGTSKGADDDNVH